MPKLSDTQAVLLAAAAVRPDLSVLPPPEMLRLNGAALERSLKALLGRGLIAQARIDVPEGEGERLAITPAGLDAIGVESARAGGTADTLATRRTDPETRGPRPRGKLGELLEAVSGPDGATLEELSAAAGWLPHTTRAAITRLRQRGYDVRITTIGARKVYQLIPAV